MKNLDSINVPPPQIQTLGPRHVSLLTKSPSPKRPKRPLKIILAILGLLILILGSIVVQRALNLSDKIFVGRKLSFFQKIQEVLTGGSQVRLVGEDLGQVNILLLGIGGEGHDGPYLTDTMILAQIRPDTGAIVLTSIPRDYWVSIPAFHEAKINEAFSDGYLKNHDYGQGGEVAMQTVGNLTGLNIPYFAVVDFSGFEKAIDQIGGLDVKVDRTFTDYTFPNDATNGYLPPQTFTAGWQHMDGQRALIFARSRHADGPEGSDFARSARQQKVIQAFKEKVLNLNLITDSGKINSLLNIFADHFHTNITPGEMFRILSLVKQNHINNFLSLSLDPATELICPYIRPDTGAYTLVPCPGKNETDVQNFFKNAFSIGKLNQEKAVIWMSSSNHDSAQYQDSDRALKQAGLTVWELPYQGSSLSKNIFYQVNPKPATAEFLKNTLNATEVTLPPPGVNADPSKVDVVVVLGGAPTPEIPEQP
ncbi:MAG: LCP family protein [Patescibacteria group bacterium]|nr:LCP family protein [Patescibacteria group bacterium]